MILIGLTGSLGSGKSTVGRMLQAHGAALIDADQITRDLQASGRLLNRRIEREFGAGVIAPDGALDRAALAKIVFSDPAALRRLNAIVHPAVRRQEAAQVARFDGHPVVVLDIPLLFENNLHRLMDWIMTVSVDDAVRLERLREQRGMDEAEARRRLAAQQPGEVKRALAHFDIDNSGSMEATSAQVSKLWNRLSRMNQKIFKSQQPSHNPFIPFRRGETA